MCLLQAANLLPLQAVGCLVPKHVFEFASGNKVLLHAVQRRLGRLRVVSRLDALALGVHHGNIFLDFFFKVVSAVHVDPGVVLGLSLSAVLGVQGLSEFQHDVAHVHVDPKAGQQDRQSMGVGFRRRHPLYIRGVQQTVGHLLQGIVLDGSLGRLDLPLLKEGIVELEFGLLGANGKIDEALLGLRSRRLVGHDAQGVAKVFQIESILKDVVLEVFFLQRPVDHGYQKGVFLRDGDHRIGRVPKGLGRDGSSWLFAAVDHGVSAILFVRME